jgi:hypothetical protein
MLPLPAADSLWGQTSLKKLVLQLAKAAMDF